MPKTALLPLISLVRSLGGDYFSIFSDDEIADALEARALHYKCHRLDLISADDHSETWGCKTLYWGHDAQIDCENRLGVEVIEADPLRGVWRITLDHKNLWVSGASYDPHGTARDLIDKAVSLKYIKYVADSPEYKRLLKMYCDFHKQSRPMPTNVPRSYFP